MEHLYSLLEFVKDYAPFMGNELKGHVDVAKDAADHLSRFPEP